MKLLDKIIFDLIVGLYNLSAYQSSDNYDKYELSFDLHTLIDILKEHEKELNNEKNNT